jgi:hypothetical protein
MPPSASLRSPAGDGFVHARATGDLNKRKTGEVGPKNRPILKLNKEDLVTKGNRAVTIAKLATFSLNLSWLSPSGTKKPTEEGPNVSLIPLSWLSLSGTKPTEEKPNVSLIPLTIGIQFEWNMNTHVYLIHADRSTEFGPRQNQVVKYINAENWVGVKCPSAPSGPDTANGESHVFFFGYPVGDTPPWIVEVFGKLKAEKIVRRTGVVVKSAEEYEIMIPLAGLSKKCNGCGRWEAYEGGTGTDKLKYRRWFKCGGCRWAYFCRPECQKLAHIEGHYKLCGGGF